jgi:hypothetical protein
VTDETTTPDDQPDHRTPKASRLLDFQRVEAQRKADILRARRDPAFFVEYCIPHDKTNKSIVNAPFHRAWHEFFSNTRLGVISAAVEHGKTLQIGVGRLLWEIGNDPELRCMIICASEDRAVEILSRIKKHIRLNKRLHEVFPHLRRSSNPEDEWSRRTITVERTTTGDPTIQARGPGAKDILGARLDLVIIDDLLNDENTGTKYARDKLHSWLDDVVMSRVVDILDGEEPSEDDVFGRVFFIGNPWNSDDLLARLSRLKAWRAMVTSAVENPDDPPHEWRPTWPAQWPLRRLMARRDSTLPHSFARKYLCRVLSDDIRRFAKAWIDHMFAQGRGLQLLDKQPKYKGSRMRCFTGSDYGIGKKKKDAETVLFTIAIEPVPPFRRVVVNIQAGRWKGHEILSRAAKTCRAFDSELCTESNVAQRWMGQFAREFEGLSVRQLPTTGKNKWDEDYGVESIAVEMRSGLWIAPTGPNGTQSAATTVAWETEYDDLAQWAQDMYDFDPDTHTGDRLMAAWKAREGARLFMRDRWQVTEHARR